MRNRDKRSLKVIFISSYLLMGILPMLIIGGIFGGIIRQSIYRSQVNAMNQISSMATNNIDRWGDKNIVLVEEVAYSQVIKRNEQTAEGSEILWDYTKNIFNKNVQTGNIKK